MKLNLKYLLIFVFIFSACSEPPKNKVTAKPNIIFIMSDDHAEQAISAYGSKLIQTPNIDRIANEGIRFNNSFVTNSICAPSRAVMLTGKYSHLNGLRDNRDEFDGSQLTFPKLLQEAGYQTSIIGKWHLKTEPTGFDNYKVLRGQGQYYGPTFIENGDTLKYEGYVTDLITDFAIENLKNRDKSKPFCLLYHHKAPHRNWMPDTKYLAMYKNEDLPLPATFYDDYRTRSAAAREQDMRIDDMYLSVDMKLQPEDYDYETGSGGKKSFNAVPGWTNSYNLMTDAEKSAWDAHYDTINLAFRQGNLTGNELLEWKYQRYMKDYLRCIASVDDNIGRLLDYLDKEGLAENTIVVYTSDQGFFLGEHGWYDKRFMYEESFSMPLIIRFPQEIAAGGVIDELVMNLDFAPTFLDYAGITIPEEMQGLSLRSLMKGEHQENWRDAVYYHYYEYPHGWHNVKQHYGVRTERYKLIHFYNDIDAWELYDLETDPHEVNNLYENPDYASIIDELKIELASLRRQYKEVDI